VRRSPVFICAVWAAAAGICAAAGPPMAIQSTETVRGQRDGVGYAVTGSQMDAVWRLSSRPPGPEVLGSPPKSAVAAICPHDDYIYAGRVYRTILPRIEAPRIILVGPLHGAARKVTKGAMIFEDYAAWRTPDGDVPVSSLRDAWLRRLPDSVYEVRRDLHDGEHSLEAIVYWLRHGRADREIVPILVPYMDRKTLLRMSASAGRILGGLLEERGWEWGSDVALVISADAVHYGTDFGHVPFGEGGIEAYAKAVERDRRILAERFAGTLDPGGLYDLLVRGRGSYGPSGPGERERPPTWCGCFSIPFGVGLLEGGGPAADANPVLGFPVSYATSVGLPELDFGGDGPGRTAPAHLYHFVGYPGVLFAFERGGNGGAP